MSDGFPPPPPGYTRMGRDGESYGPQILIANGITIAFAIITYTTRMYVKAFMIREIRIEDYLVTLALLGAIGRLATQVLLVDRYQFGQHIWDYEMANIDKWHFINKIALLIYLFAIACAKSAMLLFYIRLFGVHRRFRWLCYGLIFITVGYCTAFALVTSLSCKPISAGWGTFIEVNQAECLDQVSLSVITGGFNIATDVLIVILPLPLVAKLQLKLSDMIGVMAVLATGFIVVAVAIVRQVMILGAGMHSTDFTKVSAQIDMWLSIELNIGVAGTCLPLLAPLRKKVQPAFSSIVSLLRSHGSSRSNLSDEEAARRNSDATKVGSTSSGSTSDMTHKPAYHSPLTADNDIPRAGSRDKYHF